MSLKSIYRNIRNIFLRMRGGVRRFSFRFGRSVDAMWVVVSTLSFIASVGVLVCMALYGGFERGSVDKGMLMQLMRVIQCVFLFTIAYQIILKPGETVKFLLFRFFQGTSASGGYFMARTIPADLYRGRALAQFMAIIGAINGIASPLVGLGNIMYGTAIVFVVLAGCTLFMAFRSRRIASDLDS